MAIRDESVVVLSKRLGSYTVEPILPLVRDLVEKVRDGLPLFNRHVVEVLTDGFGEMFLADSTVLGLAAGHGW